MFNKPKRASHIQPKRKRQLDQHRDIVGQNFKLQESVNVAILYHFEVN